MLRLRSGIGICAALAIPILLLTSCSDGSANGAAAGAALDTTGTTHYLIRQQPDLIAGNDSTASLFQVLGALKLSDGNIVIANGHDRELLVVDSAGQVIRHVGRRGDGPGEFEWLGRPLRAPNGQIVILDLRLRRLTWLADTGIIRTAQLDPPTAVAQPSAIGVLNDGSVLVTTGALMLSADGAPRIERDTLPVARYRADGKYSNRLGVFPGTEFEIRANPSSPDGALERSQREFGVASGLAVANGRLVVADDEAGTLAVFDSTGRRLRTLHLAHVPAAVTTGDVKALREQRLALIGDKAKRERIATDLAQHSHPREVAPAFDPRPMVDAAGNLWIGSYKMPTDTSQLWWQVSLDGQLLGEVSVPASFSPTDVNGTTLVGIWRDADGVQAVREYEMQTP